MADEPIWQNGGEVRPPAKPPARAAKLRAIRQGPEPHGDWRDRLLYKPAEDGPPKIIGCTANAITILRNEPRWVGVLAWDELAQGIVARSAPPWDQDDAPSPIPNDRTGAWLDSDGVRVQAWLQRRYSLTVSPREAYAAALIVAESARHDPLQDWLRSLSWDGQPRAERWLSTYLGVEDTAYARFVGRAFLVSAVARGLDPGCKVDTMMVLEGPQGLKKSSALKALFGARWFSDTPLELASKDRFLGLRGLWCHEMAELDSFGRADTARVKTFLSSPTDDFRPPYGQTTLRVARRCVFAGTMNPSALGYLRDDTGNRRIWPVRCGDAIGLDAIERDRELLWAEACEMYGEGPRAGGRRWWPETPDEKKLCNEEQEERLQGDIWIGRIETWLRTNRPMPSARVSIREILTDCLGMEVSKQDRAAATRVGSCLAQLAWVSVGRVSGGQRERLYSRRPEAPAAA